MGAQSGNNGICGNGVIERQGRVNSGSEGRVIVRVRLLRPFIFGTDDSDLIQFSIDLECPLFRIKFEQFIAENEQPDQQQYKNPVGQPALQDSRIQEGELSHVIGNISKRSTLRLLILGLCSRSRTLIV